MSQNICPKCGNERVRFGKYACMICRKTYMRAYYADHAEHLKSRSLDWYYDHREHVIARVKKYLRKNKARAMVWSNNWLSRNREAFNAAAKRRRMANPAVYAATRLRYQRKHPEKCSEWEHNRRARERGAIGRHTAKEWLAIEKTQRGKCAACGKKRKLTKDHIVPISRGGSNYALNLQGLCAPCNNRKHTSIPPGTQHSIFDRLVS